MNGSAGKTLRILLVISLALNCFAIGAFASGWLGAPKLFGRHDRPTRMHSVPHPRELFRVLPDSADAVLKDTLAEHRPAVRERLAALAAARREVADALRADPYDRARLETAFEVLRQREGEVAAAAQAMIADLADRLSPEDRARVADLLPMRGPRPKKDD